MFPWTRRLQRNDGRPLAMLSRWRRAAASRRTSWPRTVTLPPPGVGGVARVARRVGFPAPRPARRPAVGSRAERVLPRGRPLADLLDARRALRAGHGALHRRTVRGRPPDAAAVESRGRQPRRPLGWATIRR